MKKVLLKKSFNKFKKLYPSVSSYLLFTKTIKGQNLTKQKLNYWFNKLVDKDDYLRSEKRGIIAFLGELTKIEEKR